MSKSKNKPLDNRTSNIVKLTHQEHYEAHRLLHLLYPKHTGLAKALYFMSHCRGGVKICSEAYASASILANKTTTRRNLELAAQGLHPAQSVKNRKLRRDQLKEIVVCEHCKSSVNYGNYLRWHGTRCSKLKGHLLATCLETGDTRLFTNTTFADVALGTASRKVLSGKFNHSKGWFFERIKLD